MKKLQPKWLKNKKKNIIFILEAIKVPTLYDESTGASLLNETIDLIINNTDFNILLKPHAITVWKNLKN